MTFSFLHLIPLQLTGIVQQPGKHNLNNYYDRNRQKKQTLRNTNTTYNLPTKPLLLPYYEIHLLLDALYLYILRLISECVLC